MIELGDVVAAHGGTSVLVITDEGGAETSVVNDVTALIEDASHAVYDEVEPKLTLSVFEAAHDEDLASIICRSL